MTDEIINHINKIISANNEIIDSVKDLKLTILREHIPDMQWSASEWNQFRRLHYLAKTDNQESFIYQHMEFLTTFAGYMLEFHEVSKDGGS